MPSFIDTIPPTMTAHPATNSAAHSAAAAANMSALVSHMDLLDSNLGLDVEADFLGVPVFTETVRRYAQGSSDRVFQQYGLLGGDLAKMASSTDCDPRVFYNVAAPASVFLCGSQGSGKSHTLSCILENCLLSSQASVLPRPLTKIVFPLRYICLRHGGRAVRGGLPSLGERRQGAGALPADQHCQYQGTPRLFIPPPSPPSLDLYLESS